MKSEKRLRDWLESRRDELSNRLTRIERDVRHQEQTLDRDAAEQALEIQNDDVLSVLDDSTRDELEKIEQALARMERGDYGRCVSCGDPISALRLKSLPYAEHCILCAEQAGAA